MRPLRAHPPAERALSGRVQIQITEHFRYDASGRLLRKDVNGAAQAYFLWQGDNLLAELTGAATGKVAEYSYYPGLDNPHAAITGTTPYFAHVDGIGNVIALTDSATKTVQREYVYDAWGGLTGGSDVKPFTNADRMRFKGALWLGPQVDVYYMRARWYEPKSGRFLSEDPIGLAGGLNSYVFAGADPVNGRDPTGLCDPGQRLYAIVLTVYYVDTGEIAYQAVLGYHCGGGGGGGPPKRSGNRLITEQAIEPDQCPLPPIAPAGADIEANIRKARAASLNVYYGNPLVTDSWFVLKVMGGGDWDYKRKGTAYVDYDPFGNFNYGATGLAAGYSASTLFRMSGWAAEKWDEGRSGKPDPLRALFGEPYSENPDDRANILAGMQYYNNACHAR